MLPQQESDASCQVGRRFSLGSRVNQTTQALLHLLLQLEQHVIS
jgi:hypothetical protein